MSGDQPGWESFCRALAHTGLPECIEEPGHAGPHTFAMLEVDELLDRCSIMLMAAADTVPLDRVM